MRATTKRMEGLDLARFLAFVGMVLVNFELFFDAEGSQGWPGILVRGLHGRAAALFVVLAGVGLGLGRARGRLSAGTVLRRALFLLVLGLLNTVVFPPDILHHYAFYFLFGALLLGLRSRWLAALVVLLPLATVLVHQVVKYGTGWNWSNCEYLDLWTVEGFLRHLFFNGWHPVLPWLAFLLFGVLLGRLPLTRRTTQVSLVGAGVAAVALAELLRWRLHAWVDTWGLDTFDRMEMHALFDTAPMPAMPLYVLLGCGVAAAVIGLCLLCEGLLRRLRVLGVFTAPGRQTLTLYIAHILLGMGTLEALGLEGSGGIDRAVVAALLFCLAAVVYAGLYALRWQRGPIEALLRR